MSGGDLDRRLRELEDREAIRELHNQYCFIQDRGHASHSDEDVAAFLGLCDPDVVWEVADGPSWTGHDAVGEYLRALWPRFESCIHYVHNLSIQFDSGTKARGRSSFYAVGDVGGAAFVAAGYYENGYVRRPEGWRFLLHREVPFFFVKANESWAGPKPCIMPEWTRQR